MVVLCGQNGAERVIVVRREQEQGTTDASQIDQSAAQLEFSSDELVTLVK